MLTFLPVDRENIKSITKTGDCFLIEYEDGSKEKISSPIQVSAEPSALGGNQWFWAIESEKVIYCNGQAERNE